MPPFELTLSDDEDLFPEIEVATPEQLEMIIKADGLDSAHEATDGDPGELVIPVMPEDLNFTVDEHRSLFAVPRSAGAKIISTEKDVHRVLKAGSRGADVEAVKRAAIRRRTARGMDDGGITTNDFMHQKDLDAIDTILYYLGALEATVKQSSLSIGAQEMIRHPGTRNPDQLARARARMEQLNDERDERERKQREKAKEKEHAASSVVEKRKVMLAALALAYRNAGSVHYTQGALRFQGIRNNLHANRGQFPNYADCSSLLTWGGWNGCGFGGPDVFNGANWAYGYTGTLATHGERLTSLVLGAAVLYGNGWPYVHVSAYCGGGFCFSHGSEIGPLKIPYNYRPVAQARSHIR